MFLDTPCRLAWRDADLETCHSIRIVVLRHFGLANGRRVGPVALARKAELNQAGFEAKARRSNDLCLAARRCRTASACTTQRDPRPAQPPLLLTGDRVSPNQFHSHDARGAVLPDRVDPQVAVGQRRDVRGPTAPRPSASDMSDRATARRA